MNKRTLGNLVLLVGLLLIFQAIYSYIWVLNANRTLLTNPIPGDLTTGFESSGEGYALVGLLLLLTGSVLRRRSQEPQEVAASTAPASAPKSTVRNVSLGLLLTIFGLIASSLVSFMNAWAGGGEILWLGALALLLPGLLMMIGSYTAHMPAVKRLDVWAITIGVLIIWSRYTLFSNYIENSRYDNPIVLYTWPTIITAVGAIVILISVIHIFANKRKLKALSEVNNSQDVSPPAN